jgi:methanogen extracellular protein (TIGR04279 family)
LLCDKKACIKALIVVVLLCAMSNVAATAQTPSTGVQIYRIMNGSDNYVTPGFLAGDYVTVELDYSVTGAQYLVTISETLPTGWTIIDSTESYSHASSSAGETYSWSITSPLTGVSTGKLYYLVHIPGSAAVGEYKITGSTAWYGGLSAIADNTPTGTAVIGVTDLNVEGQENNGPCVWISKPVEDIADADGDGHVEPGELTAYHFSIKDQNGIGSHQIYVNGIEISSFELTTDTTNLIEGIAHVQMSTDGGVTNLEIKAEDSEGHATDQILATQLPYYDYTAWLQENWSGKTVQLAALEPGSSAADGNWLVLGGGTPYRIPETNINLDAPATTINMGFTAKMPTIPLAGKTLFGGLTYQQINFTPEKTLNVPSLTQESYSIGKTSTIYTEGTNDEISAQFNGEKDMAGHVFWVMLIDLSKVTGNVDVSSGVALENSMKGLSLQDVKDSLIYERDFIADSNGDISLTAGWMGEASHLKQGEYVLMIWDLSLPNTPCLDSSMPIIVTKSPLTSDLVDQAPMPGDSLSFYESLTGSGEGDYTYFVAMIPEADYKANMTFKTTGALDGTSFEFKGLSLDEKLTFNTEEDDTSIHYVGLATDKILSEDDLSNAMLMQSILMNEFNASNVAIGSTTTTSPANVEVLVQTRDTMQKGKYIVITAAVDRKTGNLAGFNQTTVNLGGSWTFNLKKGWNLISIPIVPQTNNLTGFFGPTVMSDIAVVWEYNSSNTSSTWAYYTTMTDKYQQGSLRTVNEHLGYWVRCYNDITFTVTGAVPETSDVTLNTGWNLVGNPTTSIRQPWSTYTTAKVIWEYNSLNPSNTWSYYTTMTDKYLQGNLTELNPGYGYWVRI